MATASGISTILGIGKETSYGTYKAPTEYHKFISESLELDITRYESEAIQAGRSLSHTWDEGTHNVTGDISQELTPESAGAFLRAGIGDVASVAATSATPNIHTITLGDIADNSLTIQLSRPQITGTLDTRAYLGCQVSNWEISCGVDQYWMFKNTITGQTMDSTKTAPTSITYADEYPFRFNEASLTIDGSAISVNTITLTGDNNLKGDRFFTTDGVLKKNAVQNGLRNITGTLDLAEFDASVYNLYVNGTEGTLVLDISRGRGANEEGFKITANVRFDKTTGPVVSGREIVGLSLPFMVGFEDSDDDAFSVEVRNGNATL